MSDLDLGEAADYILSERPRLDEDAVWGVLNELGEPPARGADDMALDLLARTRPEVRPARRPPDHRRVARLRAPGRRTGLGLIEDGLLAAGWSGR